MPRDVNGSEERTVVDHAAVEASAVSAEKKARKPYPTYEERLAAADKKIEQLTRLNASRVERIAQMEAKAAQIRAAIEKSEAALEQAKAKKERLLAMRDRPARTRAPKLSPEERSAQRQEALAKARAARKAKRAQLELLQAALDESGKTMEELLAALKND